MGHKKHCKLYLVALICITSLTRSRPLRSIPLPPAGHWGAAAFDSNIVHMEQINHLKLSRVSKSCNIWPLIQSRCLSYRGDSQPASEEHQLLPKGHWVAELLGRWGHILSWCWWNFLTSANQIAQNGSCHSSRIHVPDLGVTGVWPGKMAFIKSMKTWIIFLYIWLLL